MEVWAVLPSRCARSNPGTTGSFSWPNPLADRHVDDAVATTWLVYRLTGSAVLLGTVSFCSQVPMFFLPYRRRVDRPLGPQADPVLTQILSMLQSLALAALTLTGMVRIWHVVALALVQGLANAIDMPARQAFVIQMVERREDLPNAIALNSSMVNATRLIGPAIARLGDRSDRGGLVFPGGWRELHRGHFFAAGHDYPAGTAARGPSAGSGATGGRLALCTAVDADHVFAVTAGPRQPGGHAVLRVDADLRRQGPHVGPHTLGFLMAASGVGALFAAVLLAMRKSVVGLGPRIITAATVFGAALIAFALSRSLLLSLLILPFAGSA